MWFLTNCSLVEQQIASYLHAVLTVIATEYCLMDTQVAQVVCSVQGQQQ